MVVLIESVKGQVNTGATCCGRRGLPTGGLPPGVRACRRAEKAAGKAGDCHRACGMGIVYDCEHAGVLRGDGDLQEGSKLAQNDP